MSKTLKEKETNTKEVIKWFKDNGLYELTEILVSTPNEYLSIVKDIFNQELDIDVFNKSLRESIDAEDLRNAWLSKKHTIVVKIDMLTGKVNNKTSNVYSVILLILEHLQDISNALIIPIVLLMATYCVITGTVTENKDFLTFVFGFAGGTGTGMTINKRK